MESQSLAMVCIRCATYNHELYIRDCLEGFVMQKTNFKFVAIVHDDASTDKTADIIREYEAKYPDIIKPIYETENQYSKHDGSLGRIVDAAIDATGAKYVALCEGDDYWTDPLKLQKQVDYLEGHEEYSMCFHAAEVKIEGVDVRKKGARCENLESKEYSSTDMFAEWIVPTASIVYRREVVDKYPIKHAEWLTRGDICLVLKCSHTGRVWGMSEKMSVYRMQSNSVSHNPLIRGREIYKLANHFRCLYYNFPKLEKDPVVWCVSNAYYGRMKAPNRNIWQRGGDLLMFIYWDPKYACKKLINIFKTKNLKHE